MATALFIIYGLAIVALAITLFAVTLHRSDELARVERYIGRVDERQSRDDYYVHGRIKDELKLIEATYAHKRKSRKSAVTELDTSDLEFEDEETPANGKSAENG